MILPWDDIHDFSTLHEYIRMSDISTEEKHEMYHMIDVFLTHRVVRALLTALHEDHHEELLNRLAEAPYESHHMHFLSESLDGDARHYIQQVLRSAEAEIHELLSSKVIPDEVEG